MNFDFNISNCKNSNKIIIHKITSDIFFENNNKSIHIHGKVFQNKFIDIGVPDDYYAFPEFIKNIDS